MREDIAAQTKAFLARGGKIQVIPYGESVEKYQPVKRKRREQVDHIRQRTLKMAEGRA